MKLYNLFEEVIFEGLITESVISSEQINAAINGEFANNGRKFIRRYNVHYNDGTDEGSGWRQIEVYAYGKSSTGNDVIRIYQGFGDSKRKPREPHGWKLFRLDKITGWEPTNAKSWAPVDNDYDANKMKTQGDGSMSQTFNYVDFSETQNVNNVEEI